MLARAKARVAEHPTCIYNNSGHLLTHASIYEARICGLGVVVLELCSMSSDTPRVSLVVGATRMGRPWCRRPEGEGFEDGGSNHNQLSMG